MIQEHLGNFPLRLGENTTEIYKYSPIPDIVYRRLNKEVFCSKYYLNNLCDEERFPNWPIAEPVEVFRSTQEKWKEIVQQLPIEDTDNCLEDKDVEGIDIDSHQLYSINLLLKTQLLLCKRYTHQLEQYKYPSYALLLSCLKFPSAEREDLNLSDILDCCLLRQKRYEFVRTSVELIFNTCLVSPLNAEELVKENGLSFLDCMLDFYIRALSVLTKDFSDDQEEKRQQITQSNAITEIVIHIIHTISGVAFFDFGRAAIISLKDPHRLCLNWRRCIDLKFLHRKSLGCNMLKRYALEGIASMSKNENLQKMLVECHITWPLLSSMLEYNPALATSPFLEEIFESTLSHAEINFQAFLATRALGMLCGVMKIDDLSTANNGPLCNAMKNILTQPLARMLSNSQSEDLLQTLNLNVASPVRLWDESMRAELLLFVRNMENKVQDQEHQNIQDALAICNNFEYSNLANEVNIGGVYIRIFNNMDIREAIRDLPDGSHFVESLLDFIWRSIQNSSEKNSIEDQGSTIDSNGNVMDEENHWFSISDNRFVMAVKSILHLVQLDGVVDNVMCERKAIDIVFSLLDLPTHNEVSLFVTL